MVIYTLGVGESGVRFSAARPDKFYDPARNKKTCTGVRVGAVAGETLRGVCFVAYGSRYAARNHQKKARRFYGMAGFCV